MNVMKTIEEVRHDWLLRLIEQHGTVADLNAALGRERTHAALSQIKNRAPNTSSGKVRNMGSDLAREIEVALKLERGMLDHEPSDTPPVGIVFHQLDVEAACGHGRQNTDYPEIVRSIVLSDDEARERIGSLNKSGTIRVIVAAGDSMKPTIQPRDLLFVDTAVKEFQGEGPYLLYREHEGAVCKRLSMVGKTLTVSSDNPHAGASWEWKNRHEADTIIGRVLCALPMTFKRF